MLLSRADVAVLTYGGVSLFVVVFAAYPLAAVMFRHADIPKRLIPGTIASAASPSRWTRCPARRRYRTSSPLLSSGPISMRRRSWACAALFILIFGMAYLQCRRHRARDGYGVGHINEPPALETAERRLHPLLALLPLVLLTATNFGMVRWIAATYGKTFDFATLGLAELGKIEISKASGIWAIETALCVGIISTLAIGAARIRGKIAQGMQSAVSGSLLAAINTASEYGFGGVIACLPGFAAVKNILATRFAYPLVNEAVSINILAGITGSASGGLSLALAVMGKQYQAAAANAGIDPQVLHRIASMASGGMDTLPHNGAVITLLLITGLTHRQSYRTSSPLPALRPPLSFSSSLCFG